MHMEKCLTYTKLSNNFCNFTHFFLPLFVSIENSSIYLYFDPPFLNFYSNFSLFILSCPLSFILHLYSFIILSLIYIFLYIFIHIFSSVHWFSFLYSLHTFPLRIQTEYFCDGHKHLLCFV